MTWSAPARDSRLNENAMIPVADYQARQRFARELDRNFSVVASAGSGKTRAISDRVVEIARRRPEWLPHLVIVTYTNRAADEMQQRTRQQILEGTLPLEVIEGFNRAFFGTIHSFCVKLLTAHGHHLGLAANLELITDDDDLWNQFVQQHTTIGRSLTEENRRVLLRHMKVRALMELARQHEVDLTATEPETSCPNASFEDVYSAIAHGQAMRTIPKVKEELRRWEKRWRETDEFVPWPTCASNAKEFVERWREAFRPLREWVNACALCVAAEVQRDYREFRLDRGVVTYADQVALAAELLRLPHVARRIREMNYRVILDEAQDTDPQQFFILLEVARPAPQKTDEQDARRPRQFRTPDGFVQPRSGRPSSIAAERPRAGHFCMVGDFQQSIYRSPADLAHYRALHQLLVKSGAAEELKFSVTFRLDQAQLEFVNAAFPNILNNLEGQVEFVRLNARPDILQGQVIRFDVGNHVDLTLPEARRARIESQRLAKWIHATGSDGLRAGSWSEVAILCPRKAWLPALREALLAVGVPVEVQSETEREAEHPAYAWLTALVTIMVDPHESYEIAGVLREVFGVSDDELARFGQGAGGKFQISERTRGRGLVADTLNVLVRLRDALARQPVFTAVQEIIRVSQLRERLRSLPSIEFGDVVEELEKLLSLAARIEARHGSLGEFGQNLRRNFNATRETHPSAKKAIQLITAHKAKGSEWDAVILPFLAREVRVGSGAYPRIIDGEQPQIALDRTDVLEVEDELKRAQRQEMERLLYVAATRAKHTLVLAVDPELFRGARGQVHTDTQLKWLRADTAEPNAPVVAAIPTEAEACSAIVSARGGEGRDEVHEGLATLRLQTGWFDLGRQRAAEFIQTMSPSKFAPEEEMEPPLAEDVWVEVEPELRSPRTDNPATRYGVWWHDFAERLSWKSDPAQRHKVFERTVENSPDVVRSKREWQLLQQQLATKAEFGRRLDGAVSIQSEMPFFWRVDNSKCLEGIIDLAVFDETRMKAFILDWKTNRIAPDRIEELRQLYRAQLAAYWQAVRELAGMSVEAAIYSTATGRLVVYGQEELASEWKRLRELPAGPFAALLNMKSDS
jgi:ATP-dependent helicase/nuclease subunit A